MKVFTWNVNLYINRNETGKREYRILNIILSRNTDIIFLQEASDSIISSLEKNGYTLAGKTLSHGGWCCALSKIKIDRVIINKTVGLVIDVNNKKLGTCHLAPGGANRKFRLVQLKDFSVIPDILCGDFNDERIEFLPLSKRTNSYTWFLDFFQDGSNVCKKYDHVYSSVELKNLTVFEYDKISDHVPIEFEY